MSKLILPADILEKMVCMTCKNYLSCFPVYIKNDTTNAICGRCKVPDEDRFLHDVAYENIAQFMSFPCRYKSTGCKEMLTPKKMLDHEKSCIYRKIVCPTKAYTKCQWEEACFDLKKHLEEKHTGLLMKDNQFELNFINSYKTMAVLYFENEIFIINKEVDSGTDNFICSIQHLMFSEDSKRYDYALKLTNSNKSHSYKLPRKSTQEENNTVKCNNNFVEEKLKNPATVIVTVEIMEAKSDMEEEVLSKNIQKDPNINWDLLNELECPICFDFMLPPIFQCVNGHSMCSECRPKVTFCPICKKAIQDTKNFVLEKMTQYITFPCKFYKSGCSYSAKASEIKAHEEGCEFGPYECPLKEVVDCHSKYNSSEIVDHVNNHSNFVLTSDKIDILFDRDESKEQLYLMKFSGKVFKLHYKYANNRFFWSFQLVGPPRDCKKFKFDIDVIDNSINDLKCNFRWICVPLTEKANSFNDPRTYLMLILDQIEPFITDTFSYKIRIIAE